MDEPALPEAEPTASVNSGPFDSSSCSRIPWLSAFEVFANLTSNSSSPGPLLTGRKVPFTKKGRRSGRGMVSQALGALALSASINEVFPGALKEPCERSFWLLAPLGCLPPTGGTAQQQRLRARAACSCLDQALDGTRPLPGARFCSPNMTPSPPVPPPCARMHTHSHTLTRTRPALAFSRTYLSAHAPAHGPCAGPRPELVPPQLWVVYLSQAPREVKGGTLGTSCASPLGLLAE